MRIGIIGGAHTAPLQTVGQLSIVTGCGPTRQQWRVDGPGMMVAHQCGRGSSLRATEGHRLPY